MLALLSLPLCALLIPTTPLATPPAAVQMTRSANLATVVDLPLNRPSAVFPSAVFPSAVFPSAVFPSVLLADSDVAVSEDDGKSRGRIILGVIVANSLFWQYILPIFKGQPTSTGRKKK